MVFRYGEGWRETVSLVLQDGRYLVANAKSILVWYRCLGWSWL